MNITEVSFQIIGVVNNERPTVMDDNWGEITSKIKLNEKLMTVDAIKGILKFSHLEVIYFMHLVPGDKIVYGARRPRNLPQLPEVGILAQRPKARINRIGLSCCELVEVDGLTLFVKGLDAIDGTPVIDIKPYFREFAPRNNVAQPRWVAEIMRNYY